MLVKRGFILISPGFPPPAFPSDAPAHRIPSLHFFTPSGLLVLWLNSTEQPELNAAHLAAVCTVNGDTTKHRHHHNRDLQAAAVQRLPFCRNKTILFPFPPIYPNQVIFRTSLDTYDRGAQIPNPEPTATSIPCPSQCKEIEGVNGLQSHR
ncbi:hypothetical protein P152DRAFT_244311 [Eremomyces bilateralis CBS 781.70]|uniref:Uncharacterized protein n=1 Tax=Eremomyces bilateralis CBS 781.70 TaxID=1392243 RepID=A0A6G1GAK3_9PEZI|nr:uncharacterized protein P152DRAFT_244311 [Eremomyces bilateralis CBS 781.70]KAF1815063.1 hypothetical protein P152DRAFT_244311 [Eremomyces bilateralis CBS 781.70]